jgi:hypothetical protein
VTWACRLLGAGATSDGGRRSGSATATATARSSIRGHVVDQRGPLAGASVCAATHGGLQTCATTDARGAYAIEQLFASTYRVTALAAQHRPATYGLGTAAGSWLALGVGEARDQIDLEQGAFVAPGCAAHRVHSGNRRDHVEKSGSSHSISV